ncbi:copper amine oxidase-like protein [Tumebacillus sp. BK434]|uniref:copper amine oxidase N-terminal domain-containing protein n=1 Tax=Tumebacillus sp. BK434 TaxID=2512169 RepID=UPI0010D81D96|nr:copper amine oxidase N-terminal domain-containing protein [Tumebacillus sp. BK434]TCP57800.1 copper amine oxidase-like protein [Tumebacillus sp. BK434]
MKKSAFLALLMAVALTTAPAAALATDGTTTPPTAPAEDETTTPPPTACDPQDDDDQDEDDTEDDTDTGEDDGSTDDGATDDGTTVPQASKSSPGKSGSAPGKGNADKNGKGQSGKDSKGSVKNGGTKDDDATSACGSIEGKKKGWSNKIKNILKHLEAGKKVGNLQQKLAELTLWAKSENGSQSDRDALLAILEALQAKEEVGEAAPDDLIILAETQDRLQDTAAAVSTLERALLLDYNHQEVYTELAKKLAKKGDKGVKVYVKGAKPSFDVKPVVQNGRTLVPVRAIGESLDAQVLWDEKTKTVTLINKSGKNVTLKLGNNIAIVDGKQIKLDVPAQTIGDRTMVPLRALGDFFGLTVGWENASQMATLK